MFLFDSTVYEGRDQDLVSLCRRKNIDLSFLGYPCFSLGGGKGHLNGKPLRHFGGFRILDKCIQMEYHPPP